ncbi:hypothetical protein [Nocardiopsis ganjiahuensis]|uniref:hypothetical protein n=1 Tax=Nocardiopsis ganjiahuensis TaxID=239984 RepID=UPI00034607BC|nr:hypothetical protein [Nocardiopsis ganjiahuensis]
MKLQNTQQLDRQRRAGVGFHSLHEALDAIATRDFAVMADLGGVALLMIAYRRRRTTENGEKGETTKLFTERFTTASERLGSEHAAVHGR